MCRKISDTGWPRRLLISLILSATTLSVYAETFEVPGLSGPVTLYEEANGIAILSGSSDNDIAFMNGWVHARDRFFQMDFNRRQAQGTLAELVGSPALGADVQLRSLGLGRAALASYKVMDDSTIGILQSYANGVNYWLANNPLPPEYSVLEITQADRWTPLDSLAVAKLLAFGLSFDLDIDFTISLGTYQAVGNIAGFDGTALFFEDTHRTEPPDDRVTVPGFVDSIGGIGAVPQSAGKQQPGVESEDSPVKGIGQISNQLLDLALQARSRAEASPLLREAMERSASDKGSNWWIISGDHTESGYPMLMNDPHLALDTPSTFYELGLIYEHEDDWAVTGITFAGVPGVVLGCSDFACWGATVNPLDVTDVYQEQFQLNTFGLPTHTIYKGEAEPLQLVFQSYFVNQVGDGTADNSVRANVGYDAGGITFIVPRRNNGSIIANMGDGGLSVQYTGWGATREVEAFFGLSKARSLEEFKTSLQRFDVGAQNIAYADVDGNIAYFAVGEKPIRSDLAAGGLDGGIPPFIIRDGTGALNHEWAPVANPQPEQAVPFEILPFAEMPQAVNPASGYLANGNNDPVGTSLDNNPFNQVRPGGGLYYLNPGYVAFRMGRIDREIQSMIASGNPITVADMQDLQSNNELLDAELMLELIRPMLLAYQALPDAGVFDPLEKPIDLLLNWDYSTPTGIPEGYDPGDDWMNLQQPSQQEIDHSVAATIFALFRSQMIANTIDATLNAVSLGDVRPSSRSAYNALIHHLREFPTRKGVGASGLPFINAPGITDPDEALFAVVIGSLQQALELAASDEFAPAFGNSNNVMDYRWGRLHRIRFDHPLGSDPFNVPNGGGFSDLAADLPGLSRSGGYEAVDASSHSARADGLNEFMFGSGPARRFWGILDPAGIEAGQVIPGGNSGVFLSPNYSSQLGRWLTNDYHDLTLGTAAAAAAAVKVDVFQPPGTP